MNDRIFLATGDIVHVDINCAHLTVTHRAVVKYIPQATGDTWIFEDCSSKQLVYVSEGCTISLLERGDL